MGDVWPLLPMVACTCSADTTGQSLCQLPNALIPSRIPGHSLKQDLPHAMRAVERLSPVDALQVVPVECLSLVDGLQYSLPVVACKYFHSSGVCAQRKLRFRRQVLIRLPWCS